MAKAKKSDSTKQSKTKKKQKLIAIKGGKVKKKQNEKGKKPNLKKEIQNTRNHIERSNAHYDAIKDHLTKSRIEKPPKKSNTQQRKSRREQPIDLENSFNQIELLCRTKINLAE